MDEKDELNVGCALVFVMLFLSTMMIVMGKIYQGELRDLQRRIAVLEQKQK